ncbi:MAG: helix-turn-helix domain-containing protein [Spirochaetaceae bacterium]|nr:helix-turn-helix domain-containing protein [Spirochaetaceae bacterium]
MAEIGHIFRNARVERGLTLEQVADDTNIATRYLQAIESDNFDIFPGEIYATGFIRLYAEFLDLDASALIRSFREEKTEHQSTSSQEALVDNQPEARTSTTNRAETPPDTKASSEKPARVRRQDQSREAASPITRSLLASRLLIGVLMLLVIGAIAIGLLSGRVKPVSETRKPAEYRAEGLPYTRRLYPGDRVLLPFNQDFVTVALRAIREKVTIESPYGTVDLLLNDEVVLNPSEHGNRLMVTLKDFEASKPQLGAEILFEDRPPLVQESKEQEITVPAESQATTDTGGSRTAPAPTVLFRASGGPHPFFVNVYFLAPVMFRYEADRKEWVERYYRKGESITINASNTLTLWTANAQSVRVNVYQSAGKSIEFSMGGPGEIAVKRLSWSGSGGWALVATDVD